MDFPRNSRRRLTNVGANAAEKKRRVMSSTPENCCEIPTR
jgi:hypothetical protein